MRGAPRGAPRGGFRGRGNARGGRGGGPRRDAGPPQQVAQIGIVDKIVEGKLICQCVHKDVPILRRKVFYQNKNELGNIEDVFGTTSSYGFVVELSTNIEATSFKSGDLIYGDPFNMLSLDRFTQADTKRAGRPKVPFQQGKFSSKI